MRLRPLLPALLQVCAAAAGAFDEVTLRLVLSIFDDLVETPAPVVQGHVDALLSVEAHLSAGSTSSSTV